MYKQEKNYLVLIKENDLREETGGEVTGFAEKPQPGKIADAGLQKVTLTEQKIRVDYYLNTLPIAYDTSMECRLKYRQQGETTTTRVWREQLVKSNSHYTFQLHTDKEIEEFLDCRLRIQGNYLVLPRENMLSEIAQAEKDNPDKREGSTKKKDVGKNRPDRNNRTEETGPDQDNQTKKSTSETDATEKKAFDFRKVTYIRDLEFLKQMGSQVSELYYNSFLLHGFYQYHYFVIGKDFIGVPDHFYEREAIAAKMMGFPYFIEGENVENCDISGEVRKQLPPVGSFGYFLKKVSLSPLEKPTE